MLTGIATAQLDGSPIDMDTAVNLASTVFLGGLDTLPSSIAWILHYLAEHPEQRERLVRGPTVVPGAVEEFLRVFPSVATLDTRATRDIHFYGVNMKAGDRVVTLLSAANQDGAAFERPMEVDFERRVNRHLTFSVGPHRCLGSHLARHELAVGLLEWHKMIPEYRLMPRAVIKYTGGVYALRNLPLEWKV